MSSEIKTILKNSTLFTVAPFLPKIINIFLLPIMTQYLIDVDFGISGTISAYSQAIGAFSTLGLGVVLMNSFFKDQVNYKETWQQIYGFLKIWMLLFACMQAVLLFFCIPEEAAENKWWIIILTNFSTVFFGPTATIGSTYYIYTKKAIPVVWRSVLASVITIIVDFVLIVYLRLGYMGWYVGSFAGTFFSNASYWPVVNIKLGLRPKYKFHKETIGHALSVGLPTIPHYYTNYLLQGSGRMVLDQCNVPQSEIGKVSISQQIGDIFQAGTSGLNNALSPYFMQVIKDGRENLLKKFGLLFVAIVFSLAFILAVWSKEIFDLLLANDSLKSAYPLFIAYIMAVCYRPLYCTVSNYYFFYERTKQLLLITFISGCLAILLYIVLAPKLGIWAFLVGHYIACLYFGYSGFLYSGYTKNAKIKFPFFAILILQLLLTVCAFILVDHLILKIVVSVLMVIMLVCAFLKNKDILFNYIRS